MDDINEIKQGLERSPKILKNLIHSIPAELLKKRRIRGKWSIHEHACHIVAAQPMLVDRFKLFLEEREPVIEPYIPGRTVPDEDLSELNLTSTLSKFPGLRAELVDIAKNFDEEHWTRKAKHNEYIEYTPYIMLRHILMHDNFHMYRIEELWLTRDEYLSNY